MKFSGALFSTSVIFLSDSTMFNALKLIYENSTLPESMRCYSNSISSCIFAGSYLHLDYYFSDKLERHQAKTHVNSVE